MGMVTRPDLCEKSTFTIACLCLLLIVVPELGDCGRGDVYRALINSDTSPPSIRTIASPVLKAFQGYHCVYLLLEEDSGWQGPVATSLLQIAFRQVSFAAVQTTSQRGALPNKGRYCHGLLVLAENYTSAVTQTLSPAYRLVPSVRVVLLLREALPTSEFAEESSVTALGLSHAVAVSLSNKTYVKLSPPFLPDRHWESKHQYVDKNGSPLFERLQLQAANFQNRTLRVEAFHQPPFTYIEDVKRPEDIVGTEWSIFKAISEHLNFSWTLVRRTDNERWGKPDGESWRGGALGDLLSERADIVMNVWVQENQAKVVEFSTPTKVSCLSFMVPRPQVLTPSGGELFKPLEVSVWEGWILSMLVTTVACRVLDLAAQRLRRAAIVKTEKFSTLETSFMTLLGGAVTTYIPPSLPSLGPHRHVLAWWVMYSVLMTTAFSSGLVTHLTLEQREPPINTVEDIVKRGLTWGNTIIPNIQFILDLTQCPHQHLAKNIKLINSTEDWQEAIATLKYVVQGQKLENFYFFWDGLQLADETIYKMRVMDTCVAEYYTAFALKKNSPFQQPINNAIDRMKEAGLVGYWQRRVLEKRGRRSVFSLITTHSSAMDQVQSEPTKLNMKQLGGVFYLLGTGILVSLAAWLAERYIQLNSHKVELLRLRRMRQRNEGRKCYTHLESLVRSSPPKVRKWKALAAASRLALPGKQEYKQPPASPEGTTSPFAGWCGESCSSYQKALGGHGLKASDFRWETDKL